MEDPAPSLTFKGLHRTASRFDDPPVASQSQDAAPGICRICRGEGTPDEPLFYPCKCSGSIKYVHQECLMEWLSHSKKKYCELCKTPFRFTKLYDPDMPKSLPVHVFVGHMAKYLFRNVLVWLRAAVAISVWVFGLPYFMRSAWSFLFWVSDEGLGSRSFAYIARNLGASTADFELAAALGIDTCPITPLLEPTTTPAAAVNAFLEAGLTKRQVSELLLRIFLGSMGISSNLDRLDEPSRATENASVAAASDLNSSRAPSLLGDVPFLQNLTRNSVVNRSLIDVLEGQVITVLVIVCFILIILVRDYVIQQQPEINMRAAFVAPANQIAQQGQLIIRHEEIENLRGPDESDDETLEEETAEDPDFGFDAAPDEQDHGLRRRYSAYQDHPETQDASTSTAAEPSSEQTAESQTSWQQPGTSVGDYSRIYRRANGDPKRILELIEEEGLEERLAFWVERTRRNNPDRVAGASNVESNFAVDRPESSGSTAGSSRLAYTPSSSDESAGPSERPVSFSRKGKEREVLSTPPDEDEERDSLGRSLSPGPSRPRAVSDGPQHHESIRALANNSWSFSALGSDVNAGESAGEPSAQVTFRGDSYVDAAVGPQHGLAPHPAEPPQPDQDAVDHSGLPAFEEMVDTRQPSQAPGHPTSEDNPGQDDQNLGLVDRVTDFMWGDLEHAAPAQPANNDPHAAVDNDNDDGWIDVDDIDEGDDNGRDNAAVNNPNEANPAGLDAEAIDDMEDFEGIMELIGMRGPIAGLFQNAIFCAVLVSMTILICIFVPYNIGRISLWILANPVRLVKLLFIMSKLLQDAAVLFAGATSWVLLHTIEMLTSFLGGPLLSYLLSAKAASRTLWTSAGSRVVEYAFMDFPVSASEMQNFSAISHDALITVKSYVGCVFSVVVGVFSLLFGGYPAVKDLSFQDVSLAGQTAWETLRHYSALLSNPNSWVINLSESEIFSAVDPELAYWSDMDRFWAILAGYATLFTIGALYLKRGSPFSRGNFMQAWEAGIIDTLHQASGIMKVIMIISIEMLIFPLYCGLLLDGALLPLFENATFKSRVLFTYNYPITSVFVHWFVGTGYMFHFALFVSMCRKIMRQGVLYFIRDPDDPEFHPVRDVLEKNLTTQLRKILFSAFVYGALVIVCLGGVVWGLAYGVPDVLPIHYSSNEPVLEFPVDLLFYNFLMPLAVSFFKPGDGLHAMYTWWFRTCASALRLTFFLFGERRIREEGTLLLAADSPFRDRPWYERLFLTLEKRPERPRYQVVPVTWYNLGQQREVADDPELVKKSLTKSHQFVKSGRFVRAPASDRIRIPKGRKVFLDVSETDRRLDGQSDSDLYATDQYQMVYIPPNFRMRVFLFILFIWVFAAVTGVGFTIVPLVFGRRMFQSLIPEHIRTNDIYAFSIGVYVLGSLAYLVYHIRPVLTKARQWAAAVQHSISDGSAGRQVREAVALSLNFVYAYFFLLVVLPLLVAILMELYVTIPLHTCMYPPTTPSTQESQADSPEASRHTVRVIQAWTLGLLYLKLGAKAVTTLFPETRLAVAVRTVLRRGWLYPDVNVLTRAFVVPGLALSTLAIFGPPVITNLLIRYGMFSGASVGMAEAAKAAHLAIIYRRSYPVVALVALIVRNTIGLVRVFSGWTARIRDEAYLIGERLHNFGAAATGARRGAAGGAWRAGGARL